MPKEIITENFMEKLVMLLVKSAITKKKPKELIRAINKDRRLAQAFSDLEDATEYIRQWADEKRKNNLDFAKAEDEFLQMMR